MDGQAPALGAYRMEHENEYEQEHEDESAAVYSTTGDATAWQVGPCFSGKVVGSGTRFAQWARCDKGLSALTICTASEKALIRRTRNGHFWPENTGSEKREMAADRPNKPVGRGPNYRLQFRFFEVAQVSHGQALMERPKKHSPKGLGTSRRRDFCCETADDRGKGEEEALIPS